MEDLRTEDLPPVPPNDANFARKRLLVAACCVLLLTGAVAFIVCAIVESPSAFFGHRFAEGSDNTTDEAVTLKEDGWSFYTICPDNVNASSYPAVDHPADALYDNVSIPIISEDADADATTILASFEVMEVPANGASRILSPGIHQDNIVFSPLAVASGLSMVLAGTSGRTAKQLSAALVADVRTVHQQFRHVFNELGRIHGQISLSLANRLYADDRLQPLSGYQATLDRYYKGPVESERFHTDPEACRSSINACVERTTCSCVKELLPQGSLDCGTLLALVSALYFKGRWNTPFDPGPHIAGRLPRVSHAGSCAPE
ncbi:hypothetical protein MTO96_005473 [Rhipicephalus appendiculatus]